MITNDDLEMIHIEIQVMFGYAVCVHYVQAGTPLSVYMCFYTHKS